MITEAEPEAGDPVIETIFMTKNYSNFTGNSNGDILKPGK